MTKHKSLPELAQKEASLIEQLAAVRKDLAQARENKHAHLALAIMAKINEEVVRDGISGFTIVKGDEPNIEEMSSSLPLVWLSRHYSYRNAERVDMHISFRRDELLDILTEVFPETA